MSLGLGILNDVWWRILLWVAIWNVVDGFVAGFLKGAIKSLKRHRRR